MHKSQLTNQRKDPQNNEKFHKICSKCHKAYLEKQMKTPYLKDFSKLRQIADDREKKIDVLESKVGKLDGDILNITKIVGRQPLSRTRPTRAKTPPKTPGWRASTKRSRSRWMI